MATKTPPDQTKVDKAPTSKTGWKDVPPVTVVPK